MNRAATKVLSLDLATYSSDAPLKRVADECSGDHVDFGVPGMYSPLNAAAGVVVVDSGLTVVVVEDVKDELHAARSTARPATPASPLKRPIAPSDPSAVRTEPSVTN